MTPTVCTMMLAILTGCQWSSGKFVPAVASHYHEGKFVATGERYDNSRPTAAHRTLPFGTRVLVKYRPPGGAERAMVVEINDCGPAGWTKRDIDLSIGSARRLGFVSAGVVKVKMEVLSVPKNSRPRTNCTFNTRPRSR